MGNPLISISRGPQVGYLSLLESRLVATETALFDVLTKLNPAGPDTAAEAPAITDKVIKQLQERYSNMPYSAKTAEWNQQPLQTESDLQRWWLEHRRLLAETQQSQRPVEHAAMSPPAPRPPVMRETQQSPHERPISQSSSRPDNSAQVDPDLAAELSEEQLRKYF